jgi:phage I-like protein
MKEQLIKLINSHAAAYASGDELLRQFAAEQLSDFLNGVEIIATSTEDSIDD